MPSYEHLALEDTPYEDLVARVGAMRFLGVPYTKEEQENAPELARAQAAATGRTLRWQKQKWESDIPADAKVIFALTAYLLRLGVPIPRAVNTERGGSGMNLRATRCLRARRRY